MQCIEGQRTYVLCMHAKRVGADAMHGVAFVDGSAVVALLAAVAYAEYQ